ncbi:MAG: DNA polymerase I, partial [Planctomycetes bacterium]|nr:DNA polymerase I [Planctomycetota bacterium]
MSKKFFLIDGHSHCYRAYYAIPPLSAPDGRPTNAVLGFTNILFKVLREQQPDYIAVAFDSKEPTFRHEAYEQYKANRKAMPDDLSTQIEVIKQIVQACNIRIIAKPGYEADDIIGTLAREAAADGINVFMATSDKDMLQLLDEHIFRFDASSGAIYSAETLRSEKGIEPGQMIDVLALAGDTSDNVPGVEGIGEKTALQLVKQWGTLDAVLANIDNISGKKRKERLERDADKARLSRDLVTIDTHTKLGVDVDACERQEYDAARLAEIFRELDFKKHVAELSKDITSVPEDRDYHLVDTTEKLDTFLAGLKKVKEFSFDLESTSTRPMEARIVGFSFSWQDHQAYYLPLTGPMGPVLPGAEVIAALKPILEDESIGKVGQNLKYDSLVLRNAGVRLNGITFDTMLAAYLLDPGRRRNNIVDLAMDHLAEGKIRTVELLGKGKKQITMDMADLDLVCRYACEDADVAWRLAKVLAPKLIEQGLDTLLREIEIPLMRVLEEMEWNGVKIDVPFLKEMSDDLAGKLADLEERIQNEAGVQFNVASPKQLSKVLFEKFGLTKSKKTTLGYSTSAGVLETLANEHNLPAMVLEYRQLSKLKSTYIDALPRMINKRTKRIHTSFNQTITATGRLSSSAPNLQNIPV